MTYLPHLHPHHENKLLTSLCLSCLPPSVCPIVKTSNIAPSPSCGIRLFVAAYTEVASIMPVIGWHTHCGTHSYLCRLCVLASLALAGFLNASSILTPALQRTSRLGVLDRQRAGSSNTCCARMLLILWQQQQQQLKNSSGYSAATAVAAWLEGERQENDGSAPSNFNIKHDKALYLLIWHHAAF